VEEFQDYETNENKDADADADNSVKLCQQPYLTLKQFCLNLIKTRTVSQITKDSTQLISFLD